MHIYRRSKSVKNEFNSVCIAVNLRKIWIYSNKKEKMRTVTGLNGTSHFKKKGIG